MIPTMFLRWYSESANKPPRLQQLWYASTGIRRTTLAELEPLGDWRDVPIVIEPPISTGWDSQSSRVGG